MTLSPNNAINILIQDHNEVKDLFTQFEGLGDKANLSKKIVADNICESLTTHTQIEEEVFYPEVQKSLGQNDVIDKAAEDHGHEEELIAEIQDMRPRDELFDEKVAMLGEEVEAHVRKQEEEVFPEVQNAGMDLVKLGNKMKAKREQIESNQ